MGAESEAAHDFDLGAVELGFCRSAIHAEKAPGATVDEHGIRLLQFVTVGVHVGKGKDRRIGIETKGANQENLSVDRVLPEKVEPVGVKRPRARDTRHVARLIEIGARERVSRGKLIFMSALQQNVAVKAADDRECALEKGLFEAKLHQHQQHREADAAGRAQQPRLVRNKIAPGERNRARPRHSGERRRRVAAGSGGGRQTQPPQNTSAGAARRRMPTESSAEIKAMASAAANTARRRISLIITGSNVSWRMTE